ncbi:MAG TPA: hypothetical protein V6D17_14750 [Candidatus Obscuribacterales bacterium]
MIKLSALPAIDAAREAAMEPAMLVAIEPPQGHSDCESAMVPACESDIPPACESAIPPAIDSNPRGSNKLIGLLLA